MLKSPLLQSLLAYAYAWRHRLLVVVACGLIGLLLHSLQGILQTLNYSAVITAVHHTPSAAIFMALGAVALSYFSLTGYDAISLRLVGAKVPYRVVAQTSFIGYALGNTVGMGMLTGGAVRMRLFMAAGADAGQVTRAIIINALGFGLGIGCLGAAGVLWKVEPVAAALHMPAGLLLFMSATFLSSLALWVAAGNTGRQLVLCKRSLPLYPGNGAVFGLLGVSVLDIVASGCVLWFLLPQDALSFIPFITFFAIATMVAVASHVPGGIGVFEALMFIGLQGKVSGDVLAGALLIFRVLYYFLPLALALALLVVRELLHLRLAPVAAALVSLVPRILAVFTGLVGLSVLIGGATPMNEASHRWLAFPMPLAWVEAGHLFSSLAGMALILLARSLLVRLYRAWWAALGLSLLSLAWLLPLGLPKVESLLLVFYVAALLASRQEFNHHGALAPFSLSLAALLPLGLILVLLAGLMALAYHEVPYNHTLWWQFDLTQDAPRSLRALLAMGVLTLLAAFISSRRPPAQAAALGEAIDWPSLAHSWQGKAVTLPQGLPAQPKQLPGAPVIVAVSGRYHLALAPIPLPNPQPLWQVLDAARLNKGYAAFYQLPAQGLSQYLDAGLDVCKLEDEAWVTLPVTGDSAPLEGVSLNQWGTPLLPPILKALLAPEAPTPPLHPGAQRLWWVLEYQGQCLQISQWVALPSLQQAYLEACWHPNPHPQLSLAQGFSLVAEGFYQRGFHSLCLGVKAAHLTACAKDWQQHAHPLFGTPTPLPPLCTPPAFQKELKVQWQTKYIAYQRPFVN